MSAAIPARVESISSVPAAAERPMLQVVRAAADGERPDPRREDRALVAAIRGGDPDAFERLHALYAKRLYGFALKRLGDATEAEDVVQDTLLEVHRCLGSWEGRSSLLTWMFGIAHHQLCRRFRRRSPIPMESEQLEAAPPVEHEPSADQRVDAVRALSICADVLDEEVSPAQREIFDLYYGENRPMKRIAAELGKSNQAVKISLFRTRRAMEARLAECEIQQSA
jgi:RNA polymerase sigma-70 factor (ECF subfamily)